MNKKILQIFLILLLIFYPVSAQSLLTKWLNIPEDWTKPPNLIYFVFIPFLGTFTIIWGILTATRMRIFEKPKVNVLLSFVFALALFYSGILPAIVLYLFAYGGFFGVIAFFVLFFVLTSLFAYRKVGVEYTEAKKVYLKYKDISDTRKRMLKNRVEIEKSIKKKEKEISNLQKRITNVRRHYSNFTARRITLPQLNAALNVHYPNPRDALADMERKLRYLEGRLANLNQENDTLKGQLKEVDTKLTKVVESETTQI